ncbi:hypothetical protein P4B35_04750 [Pontiellaceae bacterium B12227]|nr:hypothetical protein [Pontiellaceae bacterium B12227]
MKLFKRISVLGMAVVISGCATSSQVQEMIDASYREQTDRMDSHGTSIDVLKTSAMTNLEKGQEHAELLDKLEARLAELSAQVKMNKGFAEASKVMSAANTVKVAELDEMLKENSAADEETKARLMEIDRLYEGVMISHYQMIAESANKAIEDLKSSGWIGSSNAPVQIDEPIEIVAPTAVPITNAVPAE